MNTLPKMKILSLFCLALGFTGLAAMAAGPVRIYLANDDHPDYMWTADAETYNAVFVDMLDYYLRLAEDTKDNPAPYRSRFNADGAYWLWQYERRKSPAEFERLISRVKEGTISAPMTTLVSCYGGQPLEAVLRGMYYAGRLERRYGLRFSLATAMENQTLPLGLASLWAGSGARYTWRGVCGCASKLSNPVLGQRPHEIYWYAGQDGQRLLMKWYSLGPHLPGSLRAGAGHRVFGLQRRLSPPLPGRNNRSAIRGAGRLWVWWGLPGAQNRCAGRSGDPQATGNAAGCRWISLHSALSRDRPSPFE